MKQRINTHQIPLAKKALYTISIFCFSLFLSQNIIAKETPDLTKDKFIIPLKIHGYLQKYSKDPKLTQYFKVGEGTNNSKIASICWLYFQWLKTQPNYEQKLKEDYSWFKNEIDPLIKWEGKLNFPQQISIDTKTPEFPIDLFLNWDEKRDLNDKERGHFEVFITVYRFLNKFSQYIPLCPASFEKIMESAKGRKTNKEYTIASLLTLEQLKYLLNEKNLIQDKKLILIYTNEKSSALFKNKDSYNHFDPNNKGKITKLSSTDEVAELIFESNNFDPLKPSPIAIEIFSFDDSSKEEYPSQKKLLSKISPAILAQKDYAEGTNGLMIATTIGCIESVDYFLENGTNPDAQDKEGTTALMIATALGYTEIVELLLKKETDPNIQEEEHGLTALIAATIHGYIEIIRTLLKNGAKRDLTDKDGITALKYAIYFGHRELAKELLTDYSGFFYGISQSVILTKIAHYLFDNNAEMSFIQKFAPPGNGHCGGFSLLWLLAKKQRDKKWPGLRSETDLRVEWEGKENWSEKNYQYPEISFNWFNSTTHMLANWNQQSNDLSLDNKLNLELYISLIHLLQTPGDYFPKANQGELDKIAAQVNNKSLVEEYLISSLFTLNQLTSFLETENIIQDGKLIFIFSHDHATALFIDENDYYYFDSNSTTGEIKETSLYKIAKHIFDAHFRGQMGELYYYDDDSHYYTPSPLSIQIFSFDRSSTLKYPSQYDILNKLNPALSAKEGYADNYSGLIESASSGCLECVKYFLDKGENPNNRNKNGSTALIHASSKGHFDIVEEILKNPMVDINIETENGLTALMVAAYEGHLDIVKILLDKGADPKIISKEDKTADMYAKENGHFEIAEEIRKRIASSSIIANRESGEAI